MTIQLKDELELSTQTVNFKKEIEISAILQLFQFSNLNLIISNREGDIIFGSNAFSNCSGYSIKEVTRKNLAQVFNQNFTESEIIEIEKDPECFSTFRILKTKSGKELQINTYNCILRDFLNVYIVSILIPATAM